MRPLPTWLIDKVRECANVATQINADAARDCGQLIRASKHNSTLVDTRLRAIVSNHLRERMTDDEQRLFGETLLALADWRSDRTPQAMSRVLTLRLDTDEYDRIRIAAANARVSVSDWVRAAIQKKLTARKKGFTE